jgi:hypothetical protein
LVSLIAALLCVAGCANKSEIQRQKEAAFQAGQQQALRQLYEARFPVITVIGPVRNAKLDCTPDLTLARAIVAAEYQGVGNPREIILHHGSEETHINPKELLTGKDWPVAGGDRIEIIP